MVKAFNFDELLAAYVEASDAGMDVVVQEFIPGDDTHGVNHNAYVWDGKPLAECTAEKVRLAPPEIGFPRVVLSKSIPEVADAGRAILEGMGVYGFACTEFKRDARDGVYKLMEVNGRHNLSAALSVRCGVDFPWMMYEHLALGRLPSPVVATTGVYWISDADILQSARYALRERWTLRQHARPYLNPHVFATFDRNDMRPLVTRLVNLGRMALSKTRTDATKLMSRLGTASEQRE
jgi:predicted ATP-grasp superfamily ATP-dependent carboligase